MSAVRSLVNSEMSTLTMRQRLALTNGVLDPSSAISMTDSEIDVLFMLRKRIPTHNIRVSKLSPFELQERGLKSAMGLRELGFDCIDLIDPSFCASAVSAFGTEDIKRSFLLDASDAVFVSGSTAPFQLGIHVRRLLELCAGAPTQAKAVLKQAEPKGGALQDVPVSVILDTGLRATTLCELGYFLDNLREQTNATNTELRSLGFC
mgnify:CR=1 FL=1